MNRLLKNKFTFGLLVTIILLVSGGFFAYQKFFIKSSQVEQEVEEVDLPFDPEGPYALLLPRRDGKALLLSIKRTGSYDQIRYELAYNSEGIDRGVSGEINTKEKKGEYEQEVLFGTCSTGGKCVYDKGVENGTLTLHIKKGKEAFRMVTQWHLQQPDIALGKLASGDSHFKYDIDQNSAELPLIKYTIINDLSGAPKIPVDRQILGKVYTLNGPVAKELPTGTIRIELSENPATGSKITRFNEKEDKWTEFETKIEGSSLSAVADSGGIITVLTPKTK